MTILFGSISRVQNHFIFVVQVCFIVMNEGKSKTPGFKVPLPGFRKSTGTGRFLLGGKTLILSRKNNMREI
jgi:hypothetical protein